VTNFAGCQHDDEVPIDIDNHGVLYLNSSVRFDDVDDGTSFTLMVGEKRIGPSDLGWMSGTRASLRNTGTPLNAPEAPETDLYVGGFSSYHPGGANFAWCDGSVRFLRETVSAQVYRRLGNRNDGELVGDEKD
jgi:prepilin-type processing-associated H-X9-DG protein